MSDPSKSLASFCAANPVPMRTSPVQEGVLRPEMLQRVLGLVPAAPVLLLGGEAAGRTAAKFEIAPQQTLFIRLWVVYATEDDGTVDGAPARPREQLLPIIQAVVDNMRKDWGGTGIEWVFLPQRDFEIRKDSRLFRTLKLTPAQEKTFPAADKTYSQGDIDAIVNASWTHAHRNEVGKERPNCLLWIMGANSGIYRQQVSAKGVEPPVFNWVNVPHASGSFSGGDLEFALLNQYDLASSVQASGDDASRAAHETGHFLHLAHTHREKPPLHDELPYPDGTSVATRLATWKKRIADWIDANVPPNTSAAKALEVYDFDRASVTDTPADPGGGLLLLANGGKNGDEMGPIASVGVQTAHAGTVTFTPDRSNPMSYFLGGDPAKPMRFSPEQIAVMRGALTSGNRRRLVAAQLGDTAEPKVRIAAVWSPSSKGQFVSWRKPLATLKQQHGEQRDKQFHMTGMCAYAVDGQVFYDGFWDEGGRTQDLLFGWAQQDLEKEIVARAGKGWGVALVQAYRHPGTDLRYNVVIEQGLPKQTVVLNRTQAQLDAFAKAPGTRLRGLDSAVDDKGVTRYAAVQEAGGGTIALWGWSLEDLSPEYGKQWTAGRRLRTLSVVPTPAGPRYTALFDAENAGQLVYWLHVRERIAEIYDEMWWQGMKLRSLHTIAT